VGGDVRRRRHHAGWAQGEGACDGIDGERRRAGGPGRGSSRRRALEIHPPGARRRSARRASGALTAQERAYAALVSRAGRSLDTSYLVAVTLSREGKLREACLSNEDVRRVVGLLEEQFTMFPMSRVPGHGHC